MSPVIDTHIQERSPKPGPSVGRNSIVLTWPLSLNTTKRPRELTADEAVQLSDFVSMEYGLNVRDGFSTVGAALDNVPLRLAQYEREDLNRFTMAHTKTKLYYLNAGTWTDITRTAGAYTGADTFPYDSAVCLNNYVFTNYIDKVGYWDGTAANALDIARVLADQTEPLSGAFTGTGLTGTFLYLATEYDSVSGVESIVSAAPLSQSPVNQTVRITRPATINTFSTHWRLYRTVNGGSFPTAYRLATVAKATTTFDDNVSDATLVGLPAYVATPPKHALEHVRAKFVIHFAGRCILLNLTEESPNVTRALRLRWSKDGAFLNTADWTDLGSGFTDLAETPDPIVGAAKIGNMVVIYKKRSIIHMIETGDINRPFAFDWRVTGEIDKGVGLVSQASLASLQGFHIGLFNDNVYMYDSTRLAAIGSPVMRTLVQQLSITQLTKSFAAVIPSKQWYVLFIPQTGQTWPEQAFIYDWRRDLWVGEMKKKASAASVYVPSSVFTWDTAPNVTWDEMEGYWDESGDTGTELPSFGEPDGKTVQYADPTKSYDGLQAVWTTGDMDFGFPDVLTTLIRVRLRVDTFGSVARLQCLASPDQGSSFTVGAVKNSIQSTGEQDIYFDLRHTAKRHTVRFIADRKVQIVEWAPSFQVRGRIRQGSTTTAP